MLEDYLMQLEIEGKSEGTVFEYCARLQRFLDYLDQEKLNLVDLSIEDLTAYRTHLLQRGQSARTVNASLSTIRGFYDYLLLKGEVLTNPVVISLRLRAKQVHVERLSDDQLRDFRAYIDSLQPNLRAAFYLMMGGGLRVGEAAAVTKSDFWLVDGKLFVRISDAKWGSDREIPIVNKRAAVVVWEFLQTLDIDRKPAFRVCKRTLQGYAAAFKDTFGIDLHCHSLRHAFAARLLEKGVPITKIQYLLGHKNVNMTAHYTQSAIIDVSDIAPTIWQA